MLSETGKRRSIEVDYEKDPFIDHEIIKGIDRRVGEDYGLGAADLSEYILEHFHSVEDPENALKEISRLCTDVVLTQRIARMAMFEERLVLIGR